MRGEWLERAEAGGVYMRVLEHVDATYLIRNTFLTTHTVALSNMA
jgi:hypothetical protein